MCCVHVMRLLISLDIRSNVINMILNYELLSLPLESKNYDEVVMVTLHYYYQSSVSIGTTYNY